MLNRTTDLSVKPGDAKQPDDAKVGSLDLREILRIARRRAALVGFIVLVTTVLGIVYSLQLSPVYQGTTKILIDTRKTKYVETSDVVSDMRFNQYALASEIELIKSMPMARRVVDRLDLANNSAFRGNSSPSLFALIKLNLFGSPQKKDSIQPVTVDDARKEAMAGALRRGLSVQAPRESTVFSIQYTHPNRNLAAAVANAYAEEYLVDQLEAKYETTKRANAWLGERLKDLRTKVEDSEKAVALFRAQNNMVEAEGANLSDQQIATLNEQLILARAATAQAKVKFEQLDAVIKRGGESFSFADGGQGAVIASLRARVSETRRELADLRAKYGNKHPAVVSARAQLSDLSRQIKAETNRTLAVAENDYKVALSREKSIEESLSSLKSAKTGSTQAEITLRELERDAASNRTLYEAFLNRFKEVNQQQGLDIAESRIIERARVPGSPSGPNKRRIVLMFLVFGLCLGGGLAFVLEQLDAGFRTNEQVEETLGVPVLATVPRADRYVSSDGIRGAAEKLGLIKHSRSKTSAAGKENADKVARLVKAKPLSTFSEAMRSLRMALRYVSVDENVRSLLVTSALPGEGKSTVSSNLAMQAVNLGEKVLLIDMDLRHPVLTSHFAPNARRGIVELVTGQATFQETAILEDQRGLYFIPAAANQSLIHTSELLGSKRTAEFLAWARDNFDLVIIDTSPLLPVTDGRSLVPIVDSVALVVQWEKTNRSAVQAAIKQTMGLETKLAGIVLNDVVPEKARHYDYYSSGYYDKKYPYYYGDSETG